MATLTTNRPIKLNDVFPEWLTGNGIFNALAEHDVPWKNEIDADLLDIEYHGNYSGSKNVAPVINRILKEDDATELSKARVTALANTIYSINHTRWERLWKTIDADYNIINNYDMTETESIGVESNNTVTNTGTQTDGVNTTETGSSSGTNTAGVFGFNSQTAVDSDTASNSINSSITNVGTNTRTDNLTEHGTGERSESRTLTRSGNIGVTSSQQMLSQEREINMWNVFFSVIFPDVDKMLTIATYGDGIIYHGVIS